MNDSTFNEYKDKLEELLPLAKKAFGARTHVTLAHQASREYTQLLKTFYESGGSLVAMADSLGVTYAGLRRRVVTFDIPAVPSKTRSRLTAEETAEAVERIKVAKADSSETYHTQLAIEYDNGVSLAKIADGLGLSSSQPLYYGVQRARLRSVGA
jgi:hypothetical protein